MSIYKRLFRDEGGAVAVMLAVSLVPLSLAALGAVDLYSGLRARAELQDAADAAALAAARKGDGDPSKVSTIAAANLSQNLASLGPDAQLTYAFEPAENGKAVTGNANRAVQTIIFQYFAGQPLKVAVHTKAVREPQPQCVIALDPSASKSLWVSGSSRVELEKCSAAVDSASPDAMVLNGAAYMAAQSVDIVGGGPSEGGNLVATVRTGAPRTDDPYSYVRVPGKLPCDETAITKDKSAHFSARGGSPFVFCDGLTINGGTVTFAPGSYVIQGGSLVINGNTATRGNGVTFLLTKGATVQINGGADVDLSAPKSGDYAGLVFAQERVASGATNVFNGGADQRLDGALYFPNQAVRFNGNNRVSSGCTTLVASTIEFNGDAGFSLAGCEKVGGVRLTE